MAERAIDYDKAGVRTVIRSVEKLGMDVYMQDDQPGVYLNAYGKRIPETIAKEAGFDTGRWNAEKRIKEGMAIHLRNLKAKEAIDLNLVQKAILMENPEGFKLVGLPDDRALIEGPDGQPMFPPNALAMVKATFIEMCPDAVEVMADGEKVEGEKADGKKGGKGKSAQE